jgi:forespore regulator of the sigma-K checkpoint
MWIAVVAASVAMGLVLSQQAVNRFEAATAPVAVDSLPTWSDNLPVSYDPSGSERGKALAALSQWKGEVEITLHRVYLCGEETRKLGRHTTAEAMELLKAHRDWKADFGAEGVVRMEETVNDFSPACAKSAYIGIDQVGHVSLYDGPPRKEKVLRTFFQLDVKSLESSLSKERLKELAEGIRVADRDEFNSVLSSFSDYAKENTADVLKPIGP